MGLAATSLALAMALRLALPPALHNDLEKESSLVADLVEAQLFRPNPGHHLWLDQCALVLLTLCTRGSVVG